MNAKPQKEHEWLHQLVGAWTFEMECPTGPGRPTVQFGGTEQVHAIGGFWVLCENRSQMPGGLENAMVITLGYDPERRAYVGSWIGSMMSHFWIYEGALDAEKRRLILNAEGPDALQAGQRARYRDEIEIIDRDHRVLASHILTADGRRQRLMTVTYRRVE